MDTGAEVGTTDETVVAWTAEVAAASGPSVDVAAGGIAVVAWTAKVAGASGPSVDVAAGGIAVVVGVWCGTVGVVSGRC